MVAPIRHVGWLLVVGAFATSATGQPEPKAPQPVARKPLLVRKDRPAPLIETAFPDIKPPREWKEDKQPDGTVKLTRVDNPVVPLPPLPVLAPDDPLLRKVLVEQVREGLKYIELMESERVGWVRLRDPYFGIPQQIEFIVEVFRLAAELEEHPARQVPWLEARLRKLKSAETYTYIRVLKGYVPPELYEYVHFVRFGAEAKLLVLRAEAARAGPPPPRVDPPRPPKAEPPAPAPVRVPVAGLPEAPPPQPVLPSGYTAFPNLRPFVPRDRSDPTPFPRGDAPASLPVLPADAPALLKVQREAALEGFLCLRRIHLREVSQGPGEDYIFHIDTAANVYRLAAELEETPAERVPWYEARVRVLKMAERFTEIRILNRSIDPEALHTARFFRLRTEADLLRLQAEVARTGAAAGKKRERTPIVDKNLIGGRDGFTAFPDGFTAFPDLKHLWEFRNVKGPNGNQKVELVEFPHVLPPAPAAAADAPALRKVRAEQFQIGLDFLTRIKAKTLIQGPTEHYRLYEAMSADVYALAAALEDTPAKRIPWFEARVRELKQHEHSALIRTKNGNWLPQLLYLTRVSLLRTEADLLKLKAEVEKEKK
jgi:hypothetical protein